MHSLVSSIELLSLIISNVGTQRHMQIVFTSTNCQMSQSGKTAEFVNRIVFVVSRKQ